MKLTTRVYYSFAWYLSIEKLRENRAGHAALPAGQPGSLHTSGAPPARLAPHVRRSPNQLRFTHPAFPQPGFTPYPRRSPTRLHATRPAPPTRLTPHARRSPGPRCRRAACNQSSPRAILAPELGGRRRLRRAHLTDPDHRLLRGNASRTELLRRQVRVGRARESPRTEFLRHPKQAPRSPPPTSHRATWSHTPAQQPRRQRRTPVLS